METICVKVKLRPGSLELVHEWADELRSRADEVLATLRDEGVVVESVFLDSNEQDYLVYYMKARSLSAAREAAERSSHPIDAYPRAVQGAYMGEPELPRTAGRLRELVVSFRHALLAAEGYRLEQSR